MKGWLLGQIAERRTSPQTERFLVDGCGPRGIIRLEAVGLGDESLEAELIDLVGLGDEHVS